MTSTARYARGMKQAKSSRRAGARSESFRAEWMGRVNAPMPARAFIERDNPEARGAALDVAFSRLIRSVGWQPASRWLRTYRELGCSTSRSASIAGHGHHRASVSRSTRTPIPPSATWASCSPSRASSPRPSRYLRSALGQAPAACVRGGPPTLCPPRRGLGNRARQLKNNAAQPRRPYYRESCWKSPTSYEGGRTPNHA